MKDEEGHLFFEGTIQWLWELDTSAQPRNQASKCYWFCFVFLEIPTKLKLIFVGDGLFFWALQKLI